MPFTGYNLAVNRQTNRENHLTRVLMGASIEPWKLYQPNAVLVIPTNTLFNAEKDGRYEIKNTIQTSHRAPCRFRCRDNSGDIRL